ncbi:MAG TPA: metalloregulator ArsR/SmtB family transcription factor [Ktedonobacteraceae bacterium]|nr:metalloregulator ArsR/SmtB family transcription factor [Ktedonobacteraceae bacterium]
MRRLIVQEVAKARGFSMAGLARAAHLDRNTAQRVWRNSLYGARPATLEKIARALNVLPEELFIEDGKGQEEEEVPSWPEAPSKVMQTSPEPEQTNFAPALTEEEAIQQARLLKVLAEPTRLRILSQLSLYERRVTVSELASAYRMAQPTISSHLRILQFAGFISCYKDEQWSYYYLNRENIRKIGEFLIHTLIGSESSEYEPPSTLWEIGAKLEDVPSSQES